MQTNRKHSMRGRGQVGLSQTEEHVQEGSGCGARGTAVSHLLPDLWALLEFYWFACF